VLTLNAAITQPDILSTLVDWANALIAADQIGFFFKLLA
jgi:hypothetical protein